MLVGLASLLAARPAAAAQTLTTLASFSGVGTVGTNPQGDVALDAAGNLYGTTQNGGTNGTEFGGLGYGTVFELTAAAVPEPASMFMLGIGVSVLAGHAASRRHAARPGPAPVADSWPPGDMGRNAGSRPSLRRSSTPFTRPQGRNMETGNR